MEFDNPYPTFGVNAFSSCYILLNVFAVNPIALPDWNASAVNAWCGDMLFNPVDVDKFLLSSNRYLNIKAVNDADAWVPLIAFGAPVWLLNADSVSGAFQYRNSCNEPVNSTPISVNEPVEPQ